MSIASSTKPPASAPPAPMYIARPQTTHATTTMQIDPAASIEPTMRGGPSCGTSWSSSSSSSSASHAEGPSEKKSPNGLLLSRSGTGTGAASGAASCGAGAATWLGASEIGLAGCGTDTSGEVGTCCCCSAGTCYTYSAACGLVGTVRPSSAPGR
jgi:hypothetical protein